VLQCAWHAQDVAGGVYVLPDDGDGARVGDGGKQGADEEDRGLQAVL
jgi:hypothetical protein